MRVEVVVGGLRMTNQTNSVGEVGLNCISTCVDDKSVLSLHMFIDSTIITMDIPQDIVLSHALRILRSCWSLTADSHCLDWSGHVVQDKVQSQICQEGQCQNYHGTKDDKDRSKNWFPQTC